MCLAIPGEIVALHGEDPLLRTAEVCFGGVRREVSLACVPEAGLGDHVLVHAGLAIARLEPQRAEAVRRTLDEALAAGARK
ncbi:MAG: HypC/HybG/HupF family hydrogenase formation chaperone [Gammaproteobacteria bacterium]|nr:HypC/HybG/HupF family hydrogenase formation chaperone [Gammaproteobacteria bacterium]TVQ48579.1 MAG: HypC/HybG/HupF family hydrogenase formation chaperone [Gammaproteobacteria bacterium]